MKRLGSSDSLVAPLCPSGWLEEDDEVGEGSGGSCSPKQGGEKKRRLSAEQVRALEKNFEVENKLEPERKARLAQELGLQPRQVAVWFQNRRARWKTKQLERDFGALKSRYDSLRLDYDSLLRDKDSLLAEVKDLKSKLTGGGEESFSSIKEEPVMCESENKGTAAVAAIEEEDAILLIHNGSSDSDSSAVLNEREASPLVSFNTTTNKNSSFSSPFFYQQNSVLKVEDDEFLGGDEPCSSFFHEEQPPSLSWYCGEGWE